MNRCDIIIPIYNAYDCLKPCIESVIKNTDLKNNRLILIDDKSPDERVIPLLEKYNNNENIILLKNDVNLGFVKTVNKGMKYSNENDVLLLNSDTEVTDKWLEKIKKCAYSDEKIATVTPLSNNATFASVPKIFKPNNLPKDISLDEMAKIVDKASRKRNIEIPTGHGFCMYIKRDALNKVGFFDEEAFGKGYGEENDFCYRCIDNGLMNVLCDSVYILHKESQSFKESKNALIMQGLQKLEERYPDTKKSMDAWVSRAPIYDIGQRIALEMVKDNKKPNVLIVIHDWSNVPNNIGGTTLHVWDIIRNLRDKFNFHVLAFEKGCHKVYSYWSTDGESEVRFPRCNYYSEYSLYNNDYKEIINDIVDIYKINVCHIHHIKDNYFDVIDVLKSKNIYTIMTLHDFYSVCPLINKLYQYKEYCKDGSSEKCKKCLKYIDKNENRSSALIDYWREEWHKNLKKVDLIITPSEATKNEILMHYDDLDIKVMPHGIDLKTYDVENKSESKYFDIAFIGGIGIHKGYLILNKMAKSHNLGNIRIHLFGTSMIDIKDNNHFINHGKYNRNDLPKLLKENNIKLVCLFAIWPETFSYTLEESIASGVPVISYNLGAIEERVNKYNLGWIIPISDYKEVIKKIKNIENNKEEYNEVLDSIRKYKIKSTRQMANEYGKIYEEKMSGKLEKVDLNKIREQLDKSVINNYGVDYPDTSWVFKTLKWKIVSKIKLPKSIKNIIGME